MKTKTQWYKLSVAVPARSGFYFLASKEHLDGEFEIVRWDNDEQIISFYRGGVLPDYDYSQHVSDVLKDLPDAVWAELPVSPFREVSK